MFLRIIFLHYLILQLGCRPKVICPAFQSTYILNDSLRFAYFSPIWKLDKETRNSYINKDDGNNKSEYFASVEPHLVKSKSVNRTKFGVVRYEPNWLKVYQMRTVPQQDLIWKEEVSDDLTDFMDLGSFVASDFGLDSISGDSVILSAQDSAILSAQNSVPEKKYLYRYDPKGQNNVEQDYYNKYFGHLLVAKVAPPNEDMPTDSAGMVTDELLENDSLQVEKRNFLKRKKKKDVMEGDIELIEDDGFEEDENEEEQEDQ
tara:strand:- start:11303 stop:12082 length:780 start_codon:yes stop_codon:yes gene_type:complete